MPLNPLRTQVPPFRVHRHDHLHLVEPMHVLDLLFAMNSTVDGREAFKVDQPVNVVPRRESLSNVILVFPNATFDI